MDILNIYSLLDIFLYMKYFWIIYQINIDMFEYIMTKKIIKDIYWYYYILFLYYILNNIKYIFKRNSEIKFPIVWTDEKIEVGKIREEKRRRKKIREEK